MIERVFMLIEQMIDSHDFNYFDLELAKFFESVKSKDHPTIYFLIACISAQLRQGNICIYLPIVLLENRDFFNRFGIYEYDFLLKNIIRSSALISNDSTNTPIVFFKDRLYFRKYWDYEQFVYLNISKRLNCNNSNFNI